MPTSSFCNLDVFRSLGVFSSVCLADASSLSRTRDVCLVIAALVLAFAIWQIRVQFVHARLSREDLVGLNDKGYQFFKRRSKRRLQLACLALIVGTAIFVGSSVSPERFPRLWTCAWFCVLLAGIWVCALAVADAISTWLSFDVERHKNYAEQVLLKYKIEKFKEESLQEQKKANDKTS